MKYWNPRFLFIAVILAGIIALLHGWAHSMMWQVWQVGTLVFVSIVVAIYGVLILVKK